MVGPLLDFGVFGFWCYFHWIFAAESVFLKPLDRLDVSLYDEVRYCCQRFVWTSEIFICPFSLIDKDVKIKGLVSCYLLRRKSVSR